MKLCCCVVEMSSDSGPPIKISHNILVDTVFSIEITKEVHIYIWLNIAEYIHDWLNLAKYIYLWLNIASYIHVRLNIAIYIFLGFNIATYWYCLLEYP